MHLNVGRSKRRAAVGTELLFLSRHRIKQQIGDFLNLGNSPHRGHPIAYPMIDRVEKYMYTRSFSAELAAKALFFEIEYTEILESRGNYGKYTHYYRRHHCVTYLIVVVLSYNCQASSIPQAIKVRLRAERNHSCFTS